MKTILTILLALPLPVLAMNGMNWLASPANPEYVAECGSCHVAFAPGLLPARSWRKLMGGLDKHFDDDASLEEAQRLSLERYLVVNALDGTDTTCRQDMMAQSLSRRDTPLRISETPYFRRFHQGLAESAWKHEKVGSPANCGACHTRAAEGRYDESQVRLPPGLSKLEKSCKERC
ncbi:MAG: diheme cytochrome c [Pseudomonadota bacterium]